MNLQLEGIVVFLSWFCYFAAMVSDGFPSFLSSITSCSVQTTIE
jgi:uncharacterized membrane protein